MASELGTLLQRNMGWFGTASNHFLYLYLWTGLLPSFSSQSDHIANSYGHILPCRVHMTNYLKCSIICVGAAGEVGEVMDLVAISWLPCMEARLVDVLFAAS